MHRPVSMALIATAGAWAAADALGEEYHAFAARRRRLVPGVW